jgi:hypothetical protein
VNPATGQPYPSSQPYLSNLAVSLKHDLGDYPNTCMGMSNNYTAEDYKF